MYFYRKISSYRVFMYKNKFVFTFVYILNNILPIIQL